MRIDPNAHKLLLRTKKGDSIRGYASQVDIAASTFGLHVADAHGRPLGKEVWVHWYEVRSLHYVKSFDGHYDPDRLYEEWRPEGSEVVILFNDYEPLRGYFFRPHKLGDLRYHVIPRLNSTNDICVVAESSAVMGIYAPDEYQKMYDRELSAYVAKHADGKHPLEEINGDFHFRYRNYHRANQCYFDAYNKNDQSHELLKKVIASAYNLGVQHIRNYDLENALLCMQAVLDVDPANERVRRKIAQIRQFLEPEDEGEIPSSTDFSRPGG